VQESIVSTRQGNSTADPKPRASGPNHQNIGRACIAQDLIYFLIKGVDLNLVRARHLTQQSICFATAIKENLLKTLVFQHTSPLSSMSRPNATAIPSKDFPIEGQVYIHRRAGQNQFVWKRVLINPQTEASRIR
jgi:hypothetical protein